MCGGEGVVGEGVRGRGKKKKKEEEGSRSRTLQPVRGEGYEPALCRANAKTQQMDQQYEEKLWLRFVLLLWSQPLQEPVTVPNGSCSPTVLMANTIARTTSNDSTIAAVASFWASITRYAIRTIAQTLIDPAHFDIAPESLRSIQINTAVVEHVLAKASQSHLP